MRQFNIVFMMFTAICVQCMSVTDRRTDIPT